MRIPDNLTSLLRNLYACQEATVRTVHEKQTGFQSEKEYVKAVYCHSVYVTYIEYIRRNAGLEEAQTGITIARRNINNLRFTDDNSLMGKSEEKLRRFLMKVKEESEKSALELNISAFKKLTSWHPVPPLHGK